MYFILLFVNQRQQYKETLLRRSVQQQLFDELFFETRNVKVEIKGFLFIAPALRLALSCLTPHVFLSLVSLKNIKRLIVKLPLVSAMAITKLSW